MMSSPTPTPSPLVVQLLTDPTTPDWVNNLISLALVLAAAIVGYLSSYLSERRKEKLAKASRWDENLIARSEAFLVALDKMYITAFSLQEMILDLDKKPADKDKQTKLQVEHTLALDEFTRARVAVGFFATDKIATALTAISKKVIEDRVDLHKSELPPLSPDPTTTANFITEVRNKVGIDWTP